MALNGQKWAVRFDLQFSPLQSLPQTIALALGAKAVLRAICQPAVPRVVATPSAFFALRIDDFEKVIEYSPGLQHLHIKTGEARVNQICEFMWLTPGKNTL